MREVEVAIVGAGAAGLGAARCLRKQGVAFALLEASHRLGGRAHTELVGRGQPFDLGCHWLHSASLNPFVEIADALGFEYRKDGFGRALHLNGRWAEPSEQEAYSAFFDSNLEAACAAAAAGRDTSVADVTEREGRWTPLFDYVISLMYSVDADQVSVRDVHDYRETDENWPVKQGYGALIARFGADLPVSLNSAVRCIDWSGDPIRLETARGTLRARKLIVTVSTGILASGDIRFDPPLPLWKREAIAALPLGNHNRICLVLDDNPFGEDHPPAVTVMAGETEPMSLRIRPFGYDYVVGMTGGRFADWLERAGPEASAALAREQLVRVFGTSVAKHLGRHSVTAWGGDPWIKGAYSAALPGQGHQRAKLAEPVDERLFFAGEAASTEFFETAHGAYLSGIAAARRAAAGLAQATRAGTASAGAVAPKL